MKLLITATSFKVESGGPAARRLREFASENSAGLVFNPHSRPLTEDELIPLIQDCDGCIAGLDFITKKVIDSCGSLRVISRYGAGVDRVDLAAAKAKGIPVCNTPGANAQAVADLALGLMLATARKIPMLDRKTREGQWVRSTGIELFGKTLGVLGLGAVGKAVAQRARGFSMKILAYDPFINKLYAEEQGIIVSDFDSLIKESDIISLHLPLDQKTKHIINAEVMARMKRGAILINTARGGLIDESAADELLRSGQLGGLGLDAYEEEPPGKSPLFELDNVVVTPHTASHTAEATAAMAAMSVDNLIDVLSGKDCSYIVNK
ncbi:MAG: phosphoglycerate dehydrogenase [Treponema sp.]|jgi:D-3-phosphoglycerate dehydrogenase|nr:phosphoglycerate dehydrogenase [Treponema sp.]